MGDLYAQLANCNHLDYCFAAVFSSAASAEQDLGLYRHDDKQYWWYYADEVNFWAVVPSKENSHAADHYLKNGFGV